MRKLRYFAFLTASIFFLIPSAARAQATPTKIKLLARSTGWVLGLGGLQWTSDFGQHWRNITPPLAAGQGIADVFFLNTSQGWVLLRTSHATEQDVVYGDWGYVLAYTDDSGLSWSETPVLLPGLPSVGFAFSGNGTVDFVDPLHGWVDLSVLSGAAFSSGVLFSTADGGETWQRSLVPVGYGWVKFISQEHGWAAGGPASSDLAVTADGGETWHEVQLAPPAELPVGSIPTWYPPSFVTRGHGFLPATFNGWTVTVYATRDGGEHWRPIALLTGPPGSVGDALPLAIAGSALLMPSKGKEGSLDLSRILLSTAAKLSRGQMPAKPVLGPTFVSARRGWALTAQGLLATTDGGATWADISPFRPTSSGAAARPPTTPQRSTPVTPAAQRLQRQAPRVPQPPVPAVEGVEASTRASTSALIRQ